LLSCICKSMWLQPVLETIFGNSSTIVQLLAILYSSCSSDTLFLLSDSFYLYYSNMNLPEAQSVHV
jgi:hypothetical protein